MNFTSFFDVFGDMFSVRIEIEQNGRKQVQKKNIENSISFMNNAYCNREGTNETN